jgi:hypothetical protein
MHARTHARKRVYVEVPLSRESFHGYRHTQTQKQTRVINDKYGTNDEKDFFHGSVLISARKDETFVKTELGSVTSTMNRVPCSSMHRLCNSCVYVTVGPKSAREGEPCLNIKLQLCESGHKTRFCVSFLLFTLDGIIRVKLSLCFSLTEHKAMKAYWRSRGIAPHIFHLDTRWEWSASRSGRFTSRDLLDLLDGRVGPRAGLDAVVNRKIPSSCRDSNPRHSACSPTLYH